MPEGVVVHTVVEVTGAVVGAVETGSVVAGVEESSEPVEDVGAVVVVVGAVTGVVVTGLALAAT